MLHIIPITIDERGKVKKDVQVLGRENENLSKRLSITIPKSICDKWLYIEFQNDKKFTTPRLIVDNCQIYYDMPKSLMKNGELICQVVARDVSDVIWKSDNFEFQIKFSINATEEIGESSTDIITDMQSQLEDMKKNLFEVFKSYRAELEKILNGNYELKST